MEKRYFITQTQLADALAKWEAEAKANKWPDRDDPERHADNAAYLIEKITNG